MFAEHRRWIAAVIVVACGLSAGGQLAVAQTADSTAPAPGEAAPEGTSAPTTGSVGSTPVETTMPPLDAAEPLIPDPLAGNAEPRSSGAYADQPPFSSVPKGPDPAFVRAAEQRLASARDDFERAVALLEGVEARLDELDERIAATGEARRADLIAAAETRALLRERAVEAYVRGDRSFTLLTLLSNPVDYNRATRYLESLADRDRRLAEEYLASVRRMGREERALVDERALLTESLAGANQTLDRTRREFANAAFCAVAANAGARACADGFTFPVVGDVNFIDSFGFPRQVGNPNQHWHEGTDVMARHGAEVVAVEGGTITRIGDDSGLGGLRIWLEGDSGNRYYYAHFSSYAEGLAVGDRVEAGQLIGHVGNTGAPGAAPHLHFEVYPAGSHDPVNPYPLLITAWGERPMRSEAEVSQGSADMSGSLPAEER